MENIKVYFDNGNTITTSINGTRENIEEYYIDKQFNFGIDGDKMAKAIRVDFIDRDERFKIISTMADAMLLNNATAFYGIDYRVLCNAINQGIVALENQEYEIRKK